MRGLGQQFGVRRNGLRWLGHQLAVTDDQTGFDRGPRAGPAFQQAALDQQNVGALARWGHHRTTARPWAVGQIWSGSRRPQASLTVPTLKSLPSVSNTLATIPLASRPAWPYIAFGESWSRNTSGSTIARILKPPSSMPCSA